MLLEYLELFVIPEVKQEFEKDMVEILNIKIYIKNK